MHCMPETEKIINQLERNLAEIVTPEEFRQRLTSGKPLTHYIGFEISGYVHIGQGIMSALVMKDLTDLGVKCTVWLADWHTWINDKLDHTKATAAKIGQGYFTEAIKACFLAVGGDPEKLEFRLASEWYAKHSDAYWETVVKVMQGTSQSRLNRSLTIMGREEGQDIEGAKLLYPAMQAADVFSLQADIAHAGLDQRKAYVIMRDVASAVAPRQPKPLVILHHLLPGLTSPDGKMSKSNPASAIFIHDTAADITSKINKAYAPEKDTQKNPALAWTKHLLFWNRTEPFVVARAAKHGGDIEFAAYEALEAAYAAGDVHPMDLKAAVTKEVIELLRPVRDHFAQAEIALHKEELDKILQNR
jgi:tyrosyl-tRNA synthetase